MPWKPFRFGGLFEVLGWPLNALVVVTPEVEAATIQCLLGPPIILPNEPLFFGEKTVFIFVNLALRQ